MKKQFILTVGVLLITFSVIAQVPQSFKYQAVLRNTSGQVMSNANVNIEISILQGSALGSEIFTETHNLITNSFGLVNIDVGLSDQEAFAEIDWSSGPYFIQITVDGTVMGATQLSSVPFALHADSVTNDEVNDADSDPVNEIQTLSRKGLTVTLSKSGGSYQDSVLSEAAVDKMVSNNGYLTSTALADNIFTIHDHTDYTKKVVFEVSGISSGTTRTMIFPDYNGTIATLSGAETLFNKTLTSPVIEASPTAAGAVWTNLGKVLTTDIDGGSIDGTTIGVTTPAVGTFSGITSLGNTTISGGNITIGEPTIAKAGTIVLHDANANSSFTTSLMSNANLEASYTMIFPSNAGSPNQVLTTDGIGTLSWTNNSSLINVINDLTTGGTTDALSAEQGKVLQANKLETTASFGGDVSGTYSNLQIAAGVITTTEIANGTIAAADLSQMSATDGQVLKWNNITSTWEASDDNSSSVNVINDLTTGGTTSALSAEQGKTLKINKIETSASFGGDVSGTYSNLQIASGVITTTEIANGTIIAADLSQMSATNGQVLKWNNTSSTWEAADDDNSSVNVINDLTTGGTTNALSAEQGKVLQANKLETTASFGGDVSGTYSNLQIASGVITTTEILNGTILATDLSQMSATNGQVLKWNNTNSVWEAADDNNSQINVINDLTTGGTTVALSAEQGKVLNTNKLEISASFGGDVSGTYSNLQIASGIITTTELATGAVETTDIKDGTITVADLSQMSATDGQVLKWNNSTSTWEAANDNNSQVTIVNDLTTGGTTSALSAEQGKVLNTKKLDASASFGGDVSGTYSNLQIASGVITTTELATGAVETTDIKDGTITVADFSQMSATDGQVIKWNNTTSTWETADDNNSQVSVINDLTTGGTTVALSAEQGKVLNTNKLETTASFGGDVSGTYSNLQIASGAVTTTEILNGTILAADLSQMSATNGQVLKWNNTTSTWEAADDNNSQVCVINDLTTGGTTVALSAEQGKVLQTNKLDASASFGGDVSGTYNNLQIASGAITAADLSQMSATNGQVLKWNNTTSTWEAADDNNSQVSVINDLTTGGTTVALSAEQGKVLNTNKLETTASFGGDVSGTYSNLQIASGAVTTTEILNGTILAADLSQMSATNGQVLKWNNTTSTWEAADDNNSQVSVINDLTTGGTTVALSAEQGKVLNTSKLDASAGFGGDVSGTYSNLQIASGVITTTELATGAVETTDIKDGTITVADFSQMSATDGQILKWNNTTSTWEAADDNNSQVSVINDLTTGGTTVALSAEQGKVLNTNKLETSASFGGDVSGTYSNLQIASGAVTTTEILNSTIANEDLDKTNIPISGFGNATANVSIGNGTTNYKLINVLDPTSDQDAATKAYVDMQVAGGDFADSTFTVYDNTDNTKKIAFELSGMTTATTRTFIFPDYNGTIATIAGTETLTNKTLTTPTLTSAVLNTGVSGTAILDEDNMSSNSATQLATQQSIKAYIDSQVGGSISAVGSMTSGDAFANSTADDDWLGLGASAGRIEFDDQSTDEVNILGANMGVGINAPTQKLDVDGNVVVRGTDYNGSATPAIDIEGAWIRLGDGLGNNLTFPNGIGIKFHDSGESHASILFSSADYKMKFGRTSSNPYLTGLSPLTMTMDLANARVGIGSGASTPTNTLDVAGTFNVTGNATLGDASGDVVTVNAGTITGTPTFTDAVILSQPDINGGTIDGTTIGATTPAAGTFTALTASGDATITGGDIAIGAGTTAKAGTIVLHDADETDSFTTSLISNANVGASFSLILPANAGTANQVLVTDGNGNLSWANDNNSQVTVVNDLTTGGTTDALSAEQGKVLNTNKLETTASFGGDVSGTYNNLQIASGAVTTTEIADGTIANGDLDKTNIPISGFGNATANVSIGNGTTNYKLINVLNPTSDQDAATKAYVDTQVGNNNSFVDNIFTIFDNGDNTKKLAFELSGITTATTRTFIFPNYNGTIATITGTETLTNKTLTTPTITSAILNTGVSGTAILDEDNMSSNSATQLATQQSIKAYVDTQVGNNYNFADNLFTVHDNTDNTKKIAFEASGITTGTTRTFTLPNYDGTFATLTGTETLTNKTLTSPVIGTSPTAAGATWTDLGSVTTADINGGTIDGTTIGATTPSAATFSTVTTTGDATISGGDVTIGAGTTAKAGTIVLHDGDATDSFTTSLISNANVGTSFSLILPANAGTANQVLVTDGNGNLSWADDNNSQVTVVNDLTTGGTTSALSGEQGKVLNTNKLETTASFGGDVSGTYSDLQIASGAVTTTEIADGTIANADLDKTNIPISGFGNATANVSIGNGTTNYKLINVLNPTSDQDAATKAYVDTQVGNNNSFADNIFTIFDNGDNTKKIAFEVAGITTGTTRTFTIPDYDGTFVTLAGTETLTNKTLTSPVIGTSPTAAGATWANLGTVTTADINGGTIDGTTIGAITPAAATFTTATTTGDATITGGDITIGAGTTAKAGTIVLHDADATDSFTTSLISNANVGVSFSLILPANTGTANQVLTTDGSGALSWTTTSLTSIADADADTKIQVEESADEDIIRFDVAGGQAMVIDNAGQVGIGAFGTDSFTPGALLHTYSGATNAEVIFASKDGNYTSSVYIAERQATGTMLGTRLRYGLNNTFEIQTGNNSGADNFETRLKLYRDDDQIDLIGDVTIGDDATAKAGTIVLHDADATDSFTTSLVSNADVGASFTLTLPANDGDANQVLTTDGSGALSWTSPTTGDITAVGSMTSGDAFADATADDNWLGLGASAGRIAFDDQTTDYVNILDANVGIGVTTPNDVLDVSGNIRTDGRIRFADQVNGVLENITTNGNFQLIANNSLVLLRPLGETNGGQISINPAGYTDFYNTSAGITNRIHTSGDSYFNGGNVGIGDDTPDFTLDVAGTLGTDGDATVSGGDITIGAGTTAKAGTIVLHDGDATDSFTTSLISNANVGASFSLILPANAGTANQVLTTNGSGVLSWTSPTTGDITAVGSMTSGDAFADATADDDWLGLGASAGRIEFDDQSTDEVNILNANVGIGTSAPIAPLHIGGETSAGGNEVRMLISNETMSSATEDALIQIGRWGHSTSVIGMTGSGSGGTASNNIFVIATESGRGGIDFRTAGSFAGGLINGTSRLRITDGGSVGIGDNTPDFLLDVAGTFGADGSITTGSDGTDGSLTIYSEQGTTDYSVVLQPNAAMTETTTYTLPANNGTANQVLTTDGSGTLSWTTTSLTSIADADADTKIQVEEGTDDDIIRFDVAGTEKWVMQGSRLEAMNTGNSVFIGEDAGISDDLSDNKNVFIGNYSGQTNVSGIENVTLGTYAMYNNSTGSYNVALGSIALGLSTASNNVGIGYRAGYTDTGGSNVFIGHEAGRNSNTGEKSVFIGYQAGYNETGSNKLYIENSNSSSPLIYGDFSADSLAVNGKLSVSNGSITSGSDGNDGSLTLYSEQGTTDYSVVFQPHTTMTETTTYTLPANDGDANQVLTTDGSGALSWSTTSLTSIADADADTKIQVEETADEDIIRFDVGGTEKWVMEGSRLESKNSGLSVFIGSNAGYNDDLSNNENVFIGNVAGFSNTTGTNNVVVGASAAWGLTTGSGNVLIGGLQTGNSIGSGSSNVMLGYRSGFSATGSSNVFLGNSSGYNATGSSNVFLGISAGYNETGSNKLYIENSSSSSPLIYGDFSADSLAVNGKLSVSNGSITSGSNGSDGSLTLYSEQGVTDYSVTFQPNAAMTETTTYTLPANNGDANQVLTTDGSGSLNWTSPTTGDITAVGSMTSGDAFASATADDNWLGLGASAGRIEFDDQSTDEVNILGANVGIGTNTPNDQLDVNGGARFNSQYYPRDDHGSAIEAVGDAGSLNSWNPSTWSSPATITLMPQTASDTEATAGIIFTGRRVSDDWNPPLGGIRSVNTDNTANGRLEFWTNRNGTLINRMVIETLDGDIGIGDSSPDYKLDVAGTFGADGDVTAGSDVIVSGGDVTIGTGTTAKAGTIVLHDNQSGDSYTTSIASADNVDANFTLTLPANAGTANQVLTTDGSGALNWTSTGGNSLADADADTKIQVEESADEDIIRFDVGGTEAMMIDNSGNLSLNTSNPSDGKLTIATAGATDETLISFDEGSIGGTSGANFKFVGKFSGGGTANAFALEDFNGNTNMIWTAGGNVGIGDATPDFLLDVAGTFGADGAITTGSNGTDGSLTIYSEQGTTDYSVVFQPHTTMTETTTYTLPANNGDANQVLTTDGSGALSWSTTSLASIADADNNTKIQVEESTDENIIRFDLAGTEKWVMQGSRLEPVNTGNSVFIGDDAGAIDDLSDNQNVFIGTQSGSVNTTGNKNVGVGYYALRLHTTGVSNTAVGMYSLYNMKTGGWNAGFGTGALQQNESGNGNTAVGFNTLASNTGSFNTALGREAGYNNTGSGNVFIGYQAAYNETGSNKLYIENSNSASPLIYGDFSADSLAVNGKLSVSNGSITSGSNGSDGSLTLYSEQGVTDYSVTFQPNAAMTAATTYTLPVDDGTDNQVLTTNGSGALSWATPTGDITAVGSMTSGNAFAGTEADDDWLGLGSSAGRIEFDDQTVDEVNILDANVGIGTNAPSTALQIGEVSGEKDLTVHGDIFIGKVSNDDQFNISNVGNASTSLRYLQLVNNDNIGSFSGIALTRTGVGIGTTAPGSLLDVNGSGSFGDVYINNIDAYNRDSTAYNDGSIELYRSANDGAYIDFKNASEDYDWRIQARNDLSTLLFSGGNFSFTDGNVGIGTTGPDRKLDVLDASNPQLRLSQADGTVYADFQIDSNGDLLMNVDGQSNQLVLDNNGWIGMGTSTPNAPLNMYRSGSGDEPMARFESIGDGSIQIAGGSNGSPAEVYLEIAPQGTAEGNGWGIGTDDATNLEFSYGGVGNMNKSLVAMYIESATGEVGIGTETPGSELVVSADDNNVGLHIINTNTVDTDKPAEIVFDRTAISGGTQKAAVGVDETSRDFFIWVNGSDRLNISESGSIKFGSYSAGTLQTDASGNITASSDERLKHISGSFTKGLAALKGLQPINYKWKAESGFEVNETYSGFSAQNVQAFIPEAVGEDDKGYLTLSDRPILAATVNAVKELDEEQEGIKDQIEQLKTENDTLANENKELKDKLEGLGAEVEALKQMVLKMAKDKKEL